MTKLTKEQKAKLYSKWIQADQGLTYMAFRRTIDVQSEYIMVLWCGMYLGIEKDGYCHS
mgnify:CR=1 FL=1